MYIHCQCHWCLVFGTSKMIKWPRRQHIIVLNDKFDSHNKLTVITNFYPYSLQKFFLSIQRLTQNKSHHKCQVEHQQNLLIITTILPYITPFTITIFLCLNSHICNKRIKKGKKQQPPFSPFLFTSEDSLICPTFFISSIMGGCASVQKESDIAQRESLPSESPAKLEQAQTEEKTVDEGENKSETPNKDEEKEEKKDEESENSTETKGANKVEGDVSNAEVDVKVEATNDKVDATNAVETPKDNDVKVEAVEEPKEEAPKDEKVEADNIEKNNVAVAAPSSEDKANAPIVTL
ncbi:uncharacterized protein LOC133028922 isoform X2 [Cannabis sativa]|uniref:uncharacterized protein LOC133028922 isoform X2 n=1 Tax=Cannabis sativa TaxID=3483 RepID=UPI0029C9D83D|nr:uncharacterized protein LOC133028922 isoform X2 [Cannabis sativa]